MIQLAAPAAAAIVNSRREGPVGLESVSIGSSLFLLQGATRRLGRRFGRQCVESWLVRVMTVGTQQVSLGSVPVSGTAPVHAGAPVAQFLAMTLAADTVRFLERNPLTAGQMEEVAVGGIVAIQTPAMGLVVLQHDVGVHGFEIAPRAIDRHARVAVGARKDPIGKRRRRHVQFFLGGFRGGFGRRGRKLRAVPGQRRADSQRDPNPQHPKSKQSHGKLPGLTHSAVPPCAAPRVPTSPGTIAGVPRLWKPGSTKRRTRHRGTRRIEGAQKAVEAQNFEARKHLLEYDDVMNKQREAVYGLRRQLLEGVEQRELILEDYVGGILSGFLDEFAGERIRPDQWNIKGLE